MNTKNKIPDGIQTIRKDLSNWLWHFVRRGENEADILKKIINEKQILSSIDYLTKEEVICFTEAPLSESIRQNNFLIESNYNRLSLFGIGFQRRWLFQRNALPVIYQPNSMLNSLPQNQRWRHVELDLKKPVDFTWQREWRLQTTSIQFTEQDVILVVPDTDYLKDTLWRLEVDVECKYGETSYYGGYFKNWNFIPIEHVDIKDDSDIEICLGEEFTDIIPEEIYDEYGYI